MGASVTLWEATAPVKLPTWHGLWYQMRVKIGAEWYFTGPSRAATTTRSVGPTYPTQRRFRPNAKLE